MCTPTTTSSWSSSSRGRVLLGLPDPEDESVTVFQNKSNSNSHMVQYPIRLEASATVLSEPQTLQLPIYINYCIIQHDMWLKRLY